jgi:hypothetical protein
LAGSFSRQSSLRMDRWPLRVGALIKVVVRAISVGLIGIVPLSVLIVIFQERVVPGLTSGGIKR